METSRGPISPVVHCFDSTKLTPPQKGQGEQNLASWDPHRARVSQPYNQSFLPSLRRMALAKGGQSLKSVWGFPHSLHNSENVNCRICKVWQHGPLYNSPLFKNLLLNSSFVEGESDLPSLGASGGPLSFGVDGDQIVLVDSTIHSCQWGTDGAYRGTVKSGNHLITFARPRERWLSTLVTRICL